jgi:hypothetical protein
MGSPINASSHGHTNADLSREASDPSSGNWLLQWGISTADLPHFEESGKRKQRFLLYIPVSTHAVTAPSMFKQNKRAASFS